EGSIGRVRAAEWLGARGVYVVPIHGGYGYHRDYLAERIYRAARINRIFEGTNEINRLNIPRLVARRAARAGRALDGPPPDPAALTTAPATGEIGRASCRERV